MVIEPGPLLTVSKPNHNTIASLPVNLITGHLTGKSTTSLVVDVNTS